MVELPEGVVSVLAPGHGDEAEAPAALVVVDDLSPLHGAELAEEPDEVVLPELLPRLEQVCKGSVDCYLYRNGMLDT